MGLQQFERRLERMVEGIFARAFRSGLQPVEIGRRLTREMDLKRTIAPRGTLTPNHFEVSLSPEDATRFAPIEDELVAELVSVAKDHAKAEGYVFIGPVNIELDIDDDLVEGTLGLVAEMTRPDAASVVLADGRRVPIPDSGLTIGRLPECQIVVSDGNVSRRHAEIRASGGQYVVSDLGSTNGTKVNGRQITGPLQLESGDQVTVGSTTLRFEST
jgi:Protein of unknown function (DUF3662)/FHA domain